jgi:hypothetical protein
MAICDICGKEIGSNGFIGIEEQFCSSCYDKSEYKVELLSNNQVKIDNRVFTVGDIYNVQSTNGGDDSVMKAKICFGVYEDDEGYSTKDHIGFYVEYIRLGYKSKDICRRSLIDTIYGHIIKFVVN